MVPLPIVERELRVASRKRSSYVFRCLAVLMASAVCFWFLLTDQIGGQNSGAALFTSVSWISFWAALLSGLFTTADCLSSEKRLGTLRLLYLTNLRAYEVILGKLAARSLNAIYALLAVLPLLTLPVILGGVTPGEVFFVVLVLGVTLFVSVSVGMLISAISTSEFEALLGTFFALAMVCLLPKLLSRWVEDAMPYFMLPPDVPLSLFVSALNPYSLLEIALEGFAAKYLLVEVLLFCLVIGFAVLCLLAASFIVSRSYRDDFGSFKGWMQVLRKNPRDGGAGTPRRQSASEKFQTYRAKLLDTNPVIWLVNRQPFRGKYLWVVLGVFAAGWVAGFLFSRHIWLDLEITALYTLLLNGSIKLCLAIESPRQLAEDRSSGSWELLLSTPLREEQVLGGYSGAVRHQFMKPIIVVMVLEVLLLVIGVMFQFNPNLSVAVFIAACILLLPADAFVLASVGVWSGMRCRSPGNAAWVGIFWILILPWVVMVPHFVTWSATTIRHRSTGNDVLMWIVWLVALLAYNFCCTMSIKARATGSLRRTVEAEHGGV